MANIHIKHAHNLPREEARARIDKIAEELKKQLSAQGAWKGDSLHFKRSGASGCIDVADDRVECTIKLGMLLAPMKGKIETYLADTMHKVLDSDDPGKPT